MRTEIHDRKENNLPASLNILRNTNHYVSLFFCRDECVCPFDRETQTQMFYLQAYNGLLLGGESMCKKHGRKKHSYDVTHSS